VHAGSVFCEVELRVAVAIRLRRNNPFELQPLSGKAVAESLQPPVAQHPIDLGRQHARLAQSSRRRNVEQRLVGNAAPQKK